MTIKNLIEQLNKLDPDLEVLLSQDEEGNAYGTLWKLTEEFYCEYPTGELELVNPEDITEELAQNARCVVLWP